MSEQQREPGEAPGASELESPQSRFLPETHIDGEHIAATNVVSGIQNNTFNYQQTQKYVPPLQLPRRAEHFQDRASERVWLLAHLYPGQIVTLCGPGGMGKTALVAELLWTLAPAARPPAAFPHGIVFHSLYGRPEAAVALEQLARTFGEDPLPTPAQAAQRALSGKQVLLVLDGAEEAENLEQVLSVCASCAVLVTSRRRSDAVDPALLLDLQRLPPDDALAVVQSWQAQRETDAAVIARICQLVGGLPLALRLAGSYLALHSEEADEYLAWLEEDLWEALDQGHSSRKSVPVLLERSLACLSPSAQDVLGVIGMFALAPFERDLVVGVLELAGRAASRALDELVDYGLLVRVGQSYEVSHPLIHTYARQRLLQRSEAACASQLEQQGEAQAQAASLLSQAGNYLQKRGRYEQAEDLCKRALAICEQVFEPEHVDLSNSLDRLATLYEEQERYEEAEPLYQRALAISEQALGPDHPYIVRILSHYASLLHKMNRPQEAQSLEQRAVAIRAKSTSRRTT